MKGFIFDIKSDEDKIKILFKNKQEEKTIKINFPPYFYLKKYDKAIETMPEVKKVEKTKKEGQELYKVVVDNPGSVIKLRKDLEEFQPIEANIPHVYRFLIDKNLFATRFYEYNDEKKEFKKSKQEEIKLKMASFDLEVYNKEGMPNPEKDPIILISYCDEKESKVFSWKKGKSTEKEMILDFLSKIKKEKLDVITGYNSSGFDLPYLKKRCSILGIELDLSKDGSSVQIKKGAFSTKADIFGLLHFDSYDGVAFLSKIGAMNIPKKDLEAVYKEMFGKEKLDVEAWKIWKMWEQGGEELETLMQYNKEDAIAAYEIARELLPLYIEISKLVGFPIYEVTRMSTSQMVEWLLIREAVQRKMIIPNTPSEREVKARMMNGIEGAFVKQPERGLHEKIAVCDFRSLYPSLIIAYNIDKTTYNKPCKEYNISPKGHKFCKQPIGLIPKMLKEFIEKRIEIKKEMKKYKKGTQEYKFYYYRQWALKIIANSAYGYMVYARAKWYSREAGESVTSWAREKIHETIKKAEEKGLKVIYGDTDSIFLELGESQTKEDVTSFVKKVNSELPEGMELEFEGYFPRGIFVTGRGGERAVKKKYALIREDGGLEIKGFELVRRDWSNIAKETQRKVIKAILEQGSPEKAKEVVKKTINDIRERKIDLKDVIIYTQIKRKIDNYEQQAPHVKAAKKLIKAGYKVKTGTLLEYVIVEGSGSISDRAIPIQLIGNKKYDANYYIENQVLPAVMKIIREVGVTEDELKYKGKQAGLKKWF